MFFSFHLLGEFWRPLTGVLAVWASAHAILHRRDPRAALWWVGVSWFLPIVGPILYYFLGINRIERKAFRLRRRNPPPRLSSPALLLSRAGDPHTISPRMRHLLPLARLADSVVGRPLLPGNNIEPLIGGEAAYPAMIRAIDEAKESIGLDIYIFNDDRAGRLFIDAMARAVARGVQVRVLVDDVGAGFFWSSVDRELNERKIPVAYFLPKFAPWRVAYMNMRNHRKILTVDGRIGFAGGMNIYENHFQDIHFRVEGPVVAQMQEAFREDWYFTTGEVLTGPAWFPELKEAGIVKARGISDGPDEDFEKCRWTILGALANAQESVRLVTPYFVPDAALISGLNVAALSGIQVDIVLPEKNDLVLVQWASQATRWQVLERGCRVWLSPPPFDHSKLLLVDRAWTLFGSSNWDTRSLRLNFEFNIECYDEALANRLETLVDKKISQARRLTLAEVDARPLPQKLRDGFARLFAPHL